MQNRSRAFHALTAAALLPLLAAPGVAQTAPARGIELVVEVTNLRSTDGTVRACITSDAHRFPQCRDDAHSHKLVVPAGDAAELHFRNVLPGTYAIALLHDENDNGRADRALSMIPREGFGFSRDAPVRMGPPSFADAAITVGATAMRQTIRMRYML